MEEQNNITEPKKEKGKTGLIVGLIIVILILAGIIAILLLKPTLFNFNNTSNGNNNGNPKTEETTKKDDNSETNSKSDEIKELDLTKGINAKDNYVYSNPKENKESIGLSIKTNNDKNPKLVINWNEFGPHSTASAWVSDTKEYSIQGFTKNVKDAIVGTVGQSAQSTIIFYLMDDGTVEYTQVFNRKQDSYNNIYYEMNYTYEKDSEGRITGQHFETQGTVENVKNVIKFYNVDAHLVNGSGWMTTIGATKDGSFYDLGEIVHN